MLTDMKCPLCGGSVEWSEDDGLFTCTTPGTCTWSAYEDEL